MTVQEKLTTKTLFAHMEHTLAAKWLESTTYPWEILPQIGQIVVQIGQSLSEEEFERVGENVWIAHSASIAPSATITGPCIIGAQTQVRPGAFLRGNILVGEGCVIGNSTELKNVIIFDNVQVPHYNYVGDSVLGYKSHMGAGAITSNVKSDKTLVVVHGPEGGIETGLKKFGAILSDFVEVGCNSVLNPGTVIGTESNVYPLSCVRGFIPAHSIFKTGGVIVEKRP